MSTPQTIEILDRSLIAAKAAELSLAGYRLVQICCTPLADGYEILYSFDKEFHFLNYRILLTKENAVIPSVSSAYLAAFTYENEMKELYGIGVTDLKLDFNGTFLRNNKPSATPAASAAAPQPTHSAS